MNESLPEKPNLEDKNHRAPGHVGEDEFPLPEAVKPGATSTVQPLSAEQSRVEKEKRELEDLIQPMLMWGVIISSALMLLGLLLGLIQGAPVPESVPPFGQILPMAVAFRPAGIMALGLLVLIATPILRVAGSVLAFIYERDWRYALVTFVVFLIVLTSILLGRG